jgi:hypothetical protein
LKLAICRTESFEAEYGMNTIIAETPTGSTTLGVGFDSRSRSPQNRDAWKQSIGTTKVPARLEMLPEGESRMGRVGLSAMVQIVLLTFFVARSGIWRSSR